jgi:hypothetical protein
MKSVPPRVPPGLRFSFGIMPSYASIDAFSFFDSRHPGCRFGSAYEAVQKSHARLLGQRKCPMGSSSANTSKCSDAPSIFGQSTGDPAPSKFLGVRPKCANGPRPSKAQWIIDPDLERMRCNGPSTVIRRWQTDVLKHP